MARKSNQADAAYSEALKRIGICRQTRSSTLDLSAIELTALPPEIGQLAALTELYLFGNN
jgi:hypothetical protein